MEVCCKGHLSLLQRASEFRAKGIFTFGYLDACRICAKCFKGAPRVMAVPLLGDVCFIGGVEKLRISSPARKLHSGTSSARRKSFRRGDEETQRFFIDGIRSFCGCGQCNSVFGSSKMLPCLYYPIAFSQPRKGHAWISLVVVVRAQQKCSAVHDRFFWISTSVWLEVRDWMNSVLCMEVLVLNNVSVAM